MAAGSSTPGPRDQRPRRVRGRRRATRLDETGRVRCGRGRHGGPPHPPIPGDDLMQLDDLRALFIFDGVSDDQLRQLLAAGEEVQFREGMELFREGSPADWWWVLVDGLVDLVRQAGREEPVVMRTMDRPGLWAGGFRAWDQTSSYLATGRGASDGRMFRVPSPALGALAQEWFPFGVHL